MSVCRCWLAHRNAPSFILMSLTNSSLVFPPNNQDNDIPNHNSSFPSLFLPPHPNMFMIMPPKEPSIKQQSQQKSKISTPATLGQSIFTCLQEDTSCHSSRPAVRTSTTGSRERSRARMGCASRNPSRFYLLWMFCQDVLQLVL